MQINTLNVFNDSADIKDNSISVKQIKIEPNIIQTSDTFFASFNSDTINFEHPLPVSQIICSEHKESPNVFYSIIFPIIMLILGVAIERSAQIAFDNKKKKKGGERWRSELLTYAQTINYQIKAIDKFVKEYCDNPTSYYTPTIPVFHSIDGSMFDNLDKDDLFEYLKGKKVQDNALYTKYKEITTFVQVVKFLHSQTCEALDSYGKHYSILTDNFDRVKMEYAGDLYAASTHVLKEIPPQTYSKLSSLFNAAFTENVEINPFVLDETFINPSIELLRPYDKQVFRDLNDKLLQMKQYIGQMSARKASIKYDFIRIVEQYKLCLEMLKDIIAYFDKKNEKK